MVISREAFGEVYHRINRRFDVAPTESERNVVRDCYERIMAYGNRNKLLPWWLS